MSTAATIQPVQLTIEQIRAEAAETTKRILADANSQEKIATMIGDLTNAANVSKAAASAAQAETQKAVAELNTTKTTVESLTTRATKAETELATAKADLDKVQKALAEAQASLNTIAREKAIAQRENLIAKAELADDVKNKLRDRAKQAKADGSLLLGDDEFAQKIKTYTEIFAAGKASAAPAPQGQGGAATPPVPTPAAPAQAGAAGTPPATPPAQAAASTGAVPPAPSIPSTPDMAMALATLMQATPQDMNRVKAFAENFPMPS